MISVKALVTLIDAFFNLLGHTQTQRHSFTSALHPCAG